MLEIFRGSVVSLALEEAKALQASDFNITPTHILTQRPDRVNSATQLVYTFVWAPAFADQGETAEVATTSIQSDVVKALANRLRVDKPGKTLEVEPKVVQANALAYYHRCPAETLAVNPLGTDNWREMVKQAGLLPDKMVADALPLSTLLDDLHDQGEIGDSQAPYWKVYYAIQKVLGSGVYGKSLKEIVKGEDFMADVFALLIVDGLAANLDRQARTKFVATVGAFARFHPSGDACFSLTMGGVWAGWHKADTFGDPQKLAQPYV